MTGIVAIFRNGSKYDEAVMRLREELSPDNKSVRFDFCADDVETVLEYVTKLERALYCDHNTILTSYPGVCKDCRKEFR